MRILLIGDASNYHRCLAGGLVRAGHEVTVASHGSRWMNTGRDIDLSRRPGKVGGALLWLKLNTILASQLRGYDVVQISNPVFVDLRPERVRQIFDRLRRDNGAVYLTALGTDSQYVRLCTDPHGPLRYSEFGVCGATTPYLQEHPHIVDQWLAIDDYCRYVYDNIDGAVYALYEYYLSCRQNLPADRIVYGGIPVDVKAIPYEPQDPYADRVNIVIACHRGRETEKGIDVLLPIIRRFHEMNPLTTSIDFVQNVPFAEFQRRLSRAHVVVDQLYSYTPATTALMAMAAGKVTVSGAEPEYYDFIGEHNLKPIINPDPTHPEALLTDLQRIVDNRDLLAKLSQEGREFVLRHNDVDIVAQRFIDFWQRTLR